jgi:membrane fusion protein (multidrug efflux system)
VHKVGKGNVMEDVSATGTVKANESVMIRPDIVGRIAKINFKDGDSVCRGQVLVELDTSLQQAEKDQVQAELNLAISNFKRNEDLANKNFVSSRVKEEAESQVKVAQAKLALAEARFQRALVRAPFNGVLGLRNVSVGEYVRDGADLVTLDDLSRLRVDFKLPERYAGQAKVGMKVFVEPDAALKLRGLNGKVDSIDSVLDINGRALTLRMRIPNPRNMLKPGMFVKTKLVLSEREGAVMIPDETVSAQGRDMIVYKVEDGKAVRTVVKTGVRQLGKIEIVEGLKLGDTIIQAGLQRINRDGQPVRVVQAGGAGGRPGGPPGAPGAGGKPGEGKPGTKPGSGKPPAGKESEKTEAVNVCPPDGREDARAAGAAQGAGSGAGAGGRGPRKP